MIEVKNIEAGYDSVPKVSIESFSVKKSGVCLVRGDSGSGKTTLLNVVAGLIKPIKGSIRIGAVDPYSLRDNERDAWRGNCLGFIFQTLHLVKSLTVAENVLLGAYAAGKIQDREWVDHLLEKTGLQGLGDKKAHEISQGQAQRVAIARAAVNKPEIILADEPTSSLDKTAAKQVMELLLSLAKDNGSTLVVASHDDRIADVFDQVVELKSGENI
ncbi:MAG: ABC transporter ATP-binding protein [Pseudobdellovibrionaceae bacterium]|jgi:putative ABC transport system ATP-binding protein|nr:ABC transporter ATP-binding protein [Pseudobdellovibrionaceae bacterium]